MGTAAVILIGIAIWFFRLDSEITSRLAEGRFAPAVEFFTAPEIIRKEHSLPPRYLEAFFQRRRYSERSFGTPLEPGFYSVWTGEQCRGVIPALPPEAAVAAGLPGPQPSPNSNPSEPATAEGAEPAAAAMAALESPPQPPVISKCIAFSSLKPLPVGNSGAPSSINPLIPSPEMTPQAPTGAESAATETETISENPSGDASIQNPAIQNQETPVVAGQPDIIEMQSVAAGSENLKDEHSNTVQIVAFGENGQTVVATFRGTRPLPSESVVLEPELFAQYYGDRPILREEVPLGYTPANCLNGLLAVEDVNFLEHSGVSVTGIARAAFSALRSGHLSQGGSTITQQLVKNYFLTDERTLRRKLTEMAMALLLEGRFNKDKILETYINTIYMGQNGVFEVRGWGSAARHYFGADLRDLNLPQCALLVAVVNGPGVYDPFTKPDKALKRRTKVLDDMLKHGFTDEAKANEAKAAPLPARPERGLTEPAPYFVQTVRRQLRDRSIDESEGLRIYTSLNLRAQEAAYQAVRQGLEKLEKNYPVVKKLKVQGKNLEAILLAADPMTGQVQALVGGRGFKTSPFNRAFDSHRQVGSVMKPIVFLTALEKADENGNAYTPVTILKDEAFTHKYQGQKWSPHNYDGKFNGEVPMYYALKESLNAATASLGLSIGLSDVVDVARRLGIESKIDPFPALSLGAFELYPWEVLQVYSTLARLGEMTPITFLLRVESLGGDLYYEHEVKHEQAVAPDIAAELVGIMKQTMISGTARSVTLSGFKHPAAGKTGTTNDKKDAWFAGFTPSHTALVWVGYDDNTSHHLTGASGAVPIWINYMKSYGTSLPAGDFPWPEGTEMVSVSPEQQSALGVPLKEGETPAPVQLIFKRGQVPPSVQMPLAPDATPTPHPFKPSGI